MPLPAFDPGTPLPPEPDVTSLLLEIRSSLDDPASRLLVLDDDPTGIQTMQNIEILTEWEPDLIDRTLREQPRILYMLTNSRALDEPAAVKLTASAVAILRSAAQKNQLRFSPISRSDSTLRGHYPAELEPLVDLLPQPPDGHLIIPAYPEAGRIVFDGCHFVYDHSSGGYLPVTETDFSKDPTFGFSHYRLSEWVEEKSKGAWKASQVLSVPLRMLRDGGPEEVSSLLLRAEHNVPIVVDTVTDPDLVVLSAALLRAENAGKRFLCRTAAPFVRSRLGELPGAILDPSIIGCGPGLVLVGSYVQRTSEQLAEARALTNVDSIELLVDQLFEDAEAERHLAGVVGAIESSLASRRTALVFTSRGLVSQRGQLNHVQISAVISEALSSIPAKLSKPPTWLVAKGGITSNDVLTKGLKAKRARVLGQVASGVSALKLGPESTSPGLPFIVFPGNVGGPATLADLITMLSKGR
ncbi:MAG: hypothetical protein JOZ08_15895 [Verrucomicrobia bacterium]|nr:hypothetical protein [Verrucomicrobiota bacterium]